MDKILAEILVYKSTKQSYSVEERKKIKHGLREKITTYLKNTGDKIIEEIDSINHR